ncbi:hypothetical protein ACINB_29830 [Acidovorax sp. NB1]|nr:hypothetical protein ACINB_29830 [Acidovorax sp. NB1]
MIYKGFPTHASATHPKLIAARSTQANGLRFSTQIDSQTSVGGHAPFTASTLWIIKTGDALPSLRAVHGDFEDWIARGLVQDNNNLSALPVQTLNAHTTTAWPAMESVAGVVVTAICPSNLRPTWCTNSRYAAYRLGR